jgi:hypothetical protein
LNSWDIIAPGKMFHTLGLWATHVSVLSSSIAFSILFAAFVFVSYVMLYALTHLSPAHMEASRVAK